MRAMLRGTSNRRRKVKSSATNAGICIWIPKIRKNWRTFEPTWLIKSQLPTTRLRVPNDDWQCLVVYVCAFSSTAGNLGPRRYANSRPLALRLHLDHKLVAGEGLVRMLEHSALPLSYPAVDFTSPVLSQFVTNPTEFI